MGGGQALSVIVRGTGNAWARKFINAAEGGAANAPRLVVTYTGGGGGSVNQPPVITGSERDADIGNGAAGGELQRGGDRSGGGGADLHVGVRRRRPGDRRHGESHLCRGDVVGDTAGVGRDHHGDLGAGEHPGDDGDAAGAVGVGRDGDRGAGRDDAGDFTVSRTAGGSTVTASYATANGTAVAPGDYTTTSGTVTMTGPTLSRTVTVPVVGDTTVEPNETFTLGLSNPVGATIADGTGVATIVNDDGGGGGPVTATFTIAAGGDDVNEEGTSFAPDGALWAGNGSSATQSYLGLRFTGVTIPAGATVTAARIELMAAMTQWNTVGFEFAAEAAGNSAAFSAASRPSQRTLLVPRVTHASDAQWVSGTRYALEDISAIVQAVVSQPAWAGAGRERDRARDGECLGAQVHQRRGGRRRQRPAPGGHLHDALRFQGFTGMRRRTPEFPARSSIVWWQTSLS